MPDWTGSERRRSDPNRRRSKEDRRNTDRLAEDPAPRRDPERVGRRGSD